MLKQWDDLPDFMRVPEVKPYYDSLASKRGQLVLKRIFDLIIALLLLTILAIPMAIIAVWIKLDSPGEVFYRQERVTRYGKHFKIHKFRTMVCNADKIGTIVTVDNDNRITRVGKKLRHFRLDELPQVFDVLQGTMSFVGTRPEVVKYVEQYVPEFRATLLMPAGITSEASIRYKDEERQLNISENVDQVYIEQILPAKMQWNLKSIRSFCFLNDVLTMVRTVFVVFKRNNN